MNTEQRQVRWICAEAMRELEEEKRKRVRQAKIF
jgi:hypothetical protein